jgi:outer membrane murein-binding lipoprotein Lpp
MNIQEHKMPDVLWAALPFVVALGSGVLSFIVTQAWMRLEVAREREDLAEARAQLAQHLKSVPERVRAAEAEARRKALDEFLADVHVEERQYVREIGAPFERRRCLVIEERICFRSIPLSPWTERELAADAIAAPVAVQVAPISIVAPLRSRRLLR